MLNHIICILIHPYIHTESHGIYIIKETYLSEKFLTTMCCSEQFFFFTKNIINTETLS